MRGWVVLALLVAGCGARVATPTPVPTAVPTADQAACARQADDDPAVKLLMMKGLGNANFYDSNQAQLQAAKNESIRRCMTGRGVFRPGGVERQKPLN